MSLATRITIIHGKKGRRSSNSFTLGDGGRDHHREILHILGENTLAFLELPDVEGGKEIDALHLTLALRDKAAIIDDIEDEDLCRPFQELRDYWLSLQDSDDAFAIAELVLGS